MPQAGKAKAQHADHALHFGLFEHKALDLLHHCPRAFLCGAGRQLHIHQHGALVFIRQKRTGQALIDYGHARQNRRIHHQVTRSFGQHARHAPFISFGGACKAAVKPAEKTALGMVVPGFYRLEQGSTQSGCERERKERRERNRNTHDRRKLAVDIAHRTAEKRQRHKHRNQDHSYAHNRARNLAHRFACRIGGR